MLETVSLAHAQEADISVLDVEALIRELSTVEGSLGVRVLRLNLTHLDKHALHNAVNFRLGVTDGLSFLILKLTAKGEEVITSFGCN